MGEMKLREMLEEYREVYLPARNLSERTREEYTNDLQDLVQFLEKNGKKRVEDVGLLDLERYLAELDRRGYAGSTRKRKTVTIRSLFSFLYSSGYITSNIANRLIPPLAEKDLPRVLTEREYQRLLEACDNNKRDRAIIELLLQTGIRLSELTRLRISDVELPAGSIGDVKEMGNLHVQNKRGGGSRQLPLNDKVCRAIGEYLRFRPNSEDNVLFLNRFRNPLGQRGVQKLVKKHIDKANIHGASVHTLRQTFATHHVAKGTSLRIIQRALGYKDSRSTLIYVTLAQEMMERELQEHAL
jgi:integrase/recombinase XerD